MTTVASSSVSKGGGVSLSTDFDVCSPLEVGDGDIGLSGGVESLFKIFASCSKSDFVDDAVKGPSGLLLLFKRVTKCSAVARRWSSMDANGIGILSGINLAVSV